MTKEEKNELVAYWVMTAAHDHASMNKLYVGGEYSNALFFGHIVLEKMLKAHVVHTTQSGAPYSHDLVALRKLANLELSEDDLNLIDDTNQFNIRARYPDFKLNFYKKCTKDFTAPYYQKITALYEKLCQLLKQKQS